MKYNDAMTVLKKYTTKPNLIKHAIAVAAAMKHFAHLAGEDEEYWQVIGLLHDIDYEMYPDCHCHKCVEILRDEGFSEDEIHSIQSHGYEICTQVEPTHYMEKVLCTVDQLTGFIIACALMKPDKKLDSLTLDSIKKKWKNKGFAAGTERERIERFTGRMGKSFDWVICETLTALRGIAPELGL